MRIMSVTGGTVGSVILAGTLWLAGPAASATCPGSVFAFNPSYTSEPLFFAVTGTQVPTYECEMSGPVTDTDSYDTGGGVASGTTTVDTRSIDFDLGWTGGSSGMN